MGWPVSAARFERQRALFSARRLLGPYSIPVTKFPPDRAAGTRPRRNPPYRNAGFIVRRCYTKNP